MTFDCWSDDSQAHYMVTVIRTTVFADSNDTFGTIVVGDNTMLRVKTHTTLGFHWIYWLAAVSYTVTETILTNEHNQCRDDKDSLLNLEQLSSTTVRSSSSSSASFVHFINYCGRPADNWTTAVRRIEVTVHWPHVTVWHINSLTSRHVDWAAAAALSNTKQQLQQHSLSLSSSSPSSSL